MTAPVGLAVIGLGRMGMVHVTALADVAEIDVVAVCDVRHEALATAAALHRGAATYREASAAMAHPGTDAVLLATPTPSHAHLTERALQAGLHVLCEKPLAFDPAVARQLGRLAGEAALVLQVGYWRRFAPPWHAAHEALRLGRVGHPVMLRLSQWDADPPPAEFCDPAVSGGLAIDCGVHEFDLAAWLTGRRIVALRAEALPIVAPAIEAVGDVDNLLVVAELEGGIKAVVDLSRNARYGDDVRSEILGSEGALFVDILPTARTRVGDGSGVALLSGSTVRDAVVAGVRNQAAAFAGAIRGADISYPGAEADARAVQAGLAASESLDRKAPVRLDA